ncbi:MAG: hypothetical protein AAFY72_08700 [Cyanobacteria bacterium J06649_4]
MTTLPSLHHQEKEMTMSPQDEFVQRFFGLPSTKEALEWLRRNDHKRLRTLGEYDTTANSIQLVEEMYAAGAVRVLAVEIDAYEDEENTGKLVIELPTTQKDREKVLSIVGKIAESQGYDPEPDEEQRYVFVMLD